MEVTKKVMEFLAKTFEGFGNGVLLRELHSSNWCHNSQLVLAMSSFSLFANFYCGLKTVAHNAHCNALYTKKSLVNVSGAFEVFLIVSPTIYLVK